MVFLSARPYCFVSLLSLPQIKHVKKALTSQTVTALMSHIDSVLVVPVAFMQSALHSCDSAGAAGRDAYVVHSLIIYAVHSIFLLSLLYASSLSWRKPKSLIDTSFQQRVSSCKEIKEDCCNCSAHTTQLQSLHVFLCPESYLSGSTGWGKKAVLILLSSFQ